MSALAEAAAFLAQQWPVFPCGPDKRPVTERGFYDAVRDDGEVRRLFNVRGAVLIGVPTGPGSDLAVIDLDVKDGRHGLEWLAANEHRLPKTRRHRTMSGGFHLLFRYPHGRSIRNRAALRIDGQRVPGVDVRGEGGYIIAPPSPGYEIHDDAMPADMPGWLVDLLDPPQPPPRPALPPQPRRALQSGDGTPYGLSGLVRECNSIRTAPDGAKHETLNRAAYSIGGLVAAGELVEGAAFSALAAALADIRDRCEDYRAAERTLRTAFADGMAQPRQPVTPRPMSYQINITVPPPDLAPWDAVPEHLDAEPDIADVRADVRADVPARLRDPPAGFPTLGIAEILALPPPEWLVHGLLTVDGNALLYGPWASLKSFLALDIALSLAYGRPWQGREVRQCGVLYVAGEGARGLGKRIKAWLLHHGLEDVDAPFRLLSAGVNVTDPEHVARLIASAKAAADIEGQPIGVAFIDTLARAMVGADENSSQDMGRAIHGIDEFRGALPAATVTVHHSGKDKERGTRGSSALPGAADTIIAVERNELRLTVTVEKQKDDEEGEPINLIAQKVALDGGDVVEGAPTSLVLVADDAGNGPAVRPSGRLSGDQQQALKVLHDALAECGEPGFPGVPPGLPSIPEDWWRDRFYDRAKPGAEQSAKQKAFRRAADALAGSGMVAANRGRVWATR